MGSAGRPTSQAMDSSPHARWRLCAAVTERRRSIALRRAVVSSHPAGLSGIPSSGPVGCGRLHRVVQRVLGQIEVPQDPDQDGQQPAAIGCVDGFERPVRGADAAGLPRESSSGYISATGRTSTEPNLADGTMVAALIAWSRLSQSMM